MKINAISGCPRSGTSLASMLVRSAVGPDSFVGVKFFEGQGVESKRLNPKGFFECRYTVNGIRWHDGIEDNDGKYAKIVSQGLAQSNPDYIGRILYMIREPRKVAHSQENLRHAVPIPDGDKFHSPAMFCQVTHRFAKWAVAQGKVDVVCVVDYDDLLSDPTAQAKRIASHFDLLFSDFDMSLIDGKLNRSTPQSHNHDLWPIADAMYAAVKVGDWQTVLDVANANLDAIYADKKLYNCQRLQSRMGRAECINCVHNKDTRRTFRDMAEAKGIDWRQKPCAYLSAMTENDTVALNHWDDTVAPPPPPLTEQAKLALATIAKVVGHAAKNGQVLARADIVNKRIAACKSCSMRELNKCNACGCHLPRAVRIAAKKCPLNRWEN